MASPTWSSARQQKWLASQQPQVPIALRFLLDASGSMAPYAAALRGAYNMYLRYVQREAHPLSMIDTRCFGHLLQRRTTDPPLLSWLEVPLPGADPMALGLAQPLSLDTYSANYGGTALFDAIGTVLTTTPADGQYQEILVVFSDGADNMSTTWEAATVCEVLTTLQDASGWLAVFLAAYVGGMDVARACGFREGNILEFPNDALPAAFETLRRATQQYLQAGPAERKLLAEKGIF